MNANSFTVNTNTTEQLELDAKFAPVRSTRLKHSIDTESMCIATDEVVVRTANRTWAHRPKPAGSGDPCDQKMSGAGRVAKTRKLLDRSIAYAWKTVQPRCRPPALTPTRWVWQLAGSYHLCRPIPQLMEEVAQRFASMGRESLAQCVAQKAIEERGHDLLALLDIRSMGYEAEALVKALFPPAAAALINYVTQSINAPEPIGWLGYCYTMERLAAGIGEEYIQTVEDLLPPGIQATRCLRAHSRLGSELEHLEETVEVVSGLTPEERTSVMFACYETALLCFSPPKEGYISEAQLQNVLRPLVSRKHLSSRVDFQLLAK